ncbi:MAG: anthranilate synthase component I family protein, partial [Prevotella sp.]|nr:anthranilate synthase component I family protein [Prevotella sp.]
MRFKYHTKSRHRLGDLITPVSAYLRVRDVYPRSALMESSDFHGRENAKSFIALHPIASVSIAHGKGRILLPDNSGEEREINDKADAVGLVNDFIRSFDISGEDTEYCGLYGYTSFNAVRYFEHIDVKDETLAENDAPDLMYVLYKDIVVFDHFRSEMTIVELLQDGEEDSLARLEQDLMNLPCRVYDFRPAGDCT